jgi:hypothetical protein
MSIANALKKASSASLKKLGGDVTIKQITAGSYVTSFDDISSFDSISNIDDFTGGTIEESISNFTIKGVIQNSTRLRANNLIESQDKLVTISAGDLTFVPTTKDRVVISSVEFKIVQVITNEQNNTPVSFDLILR